MSSSLFVRSQVWICFFSYWSLLMSNMQTPGGRVIPSVALWINFGLWGDRRKCSVCVSAIALESHFCTFLLFLSGWLANWDFWPLKSRWPMTLVFLQASYSWQAFLSALTSLGSGSEPTWGMPGLVWCAVNDSSRFYSGGGEQAVATLRKQGDLQRMLGSDSLDNQDGRGSKNSIVFMLLPGWYPIQHFLLVQVWILILTSLFTFLIFLLRGNAFRRQKFKYVQTMNTQTECKKNHVKKGTLPHAMKLCKSSHVQKRLLNLGLLPVFWESSTHILPWEGKNNCSVQVLYLREGRFLLTYPGSSGSWTNTLGCISLKGLSETTYPIALWYLGPWGARKSAGCHILTRTSCRGFIWLRDGREQLAQLVVGREQATRGMDLNAG